MSIEDFVDLYHDEIRNIIAAVNPNHLIDMNDMPELELWISNNEILYYWAMRAGVSI